MGGRELSGFDQKKKIDLARFARACVRACVRACARVCARACVCARVRACACVARVCVFVLKISSTLCTSITSTGASPAAEFVSVLCVILKTGTSSSLCNYFLLCRQTCT